MGRSESWAGGVCMDVAARPGAPAGDSVARRARPMSARVAAVAVAIRSPCAVRWSATPNVTIHTDGPRRHQKMRCTAAVIDSTLLLGAGVLADTTSAQRSLGPLDAFRAQNHVG